MVLFRVLLLVIFIQSTSGQGTCSTQLRLVNGGDQYAGRVEALRNGVWQTVCDESWDIFEANVVCRQLGYGTARNAITDSYFGEGGSEQWERSWGCSGTESCLESCRSFAVSSTRCSSDQNAGVICSISSVNVNVPIGVSSGGTTIHGVAVGVGVGVTCLILCVSLPLGIIITVAVVCLCCIRKPRRAQGTNASSSPPKRGGQIPMGSSGEPVPVYNADAPTAAGYTNKPAQVSYLPSSYPAPSAGDPVLQDSSQQPTNSEWQPAVLPYPAVSDAQNDLPPAYNSVLASAPPYPAGQGPPPSSQYHYH